MTVLKISGLSGAFLLSLLGGAAAGFSYEALANQDYLQYGDVSFSPFFSLQTYGIPCIGSRQGAFVCASLQGDCGQTCWPMANVRILTRHANLRTPHFSTTA